MPAARKWLRRVFLAVVATPLVVGLMLLGVLTLTVAGPSGTARVGSLDGRVRIVRDSEWVPHIFAGSRDDLAAGLGFAHAQDRLWQMELMRRAGQGRLSEVFGAATLETDVFLRTLDFYGHAQRSFERLPTDARTALEAYARGVNGFLERRLGWLETRLPPEFLLLWHRPEPWLPADSLVAIKLMSLTLSGNLRQELSRLTLTAQGLSPAEIEDLLPPNPGEAAPPLPDLGRLYPLKRPAPIAPVRHAAGLLDHIGLGASNNWVVAGTRTKSGKPLLANDPHLRLSAPSAWYLAHLSLSAAGSERADMVGATLPGLPLVVLGRSGTLAWGFTSTGADVQDVFIEKVRPGRPDEYQTPDGWRRFESNETIIRVRGRADHKLIRRRTRHGPVLPAGYSGLGATLGHGHVAALAWTALSDDDTTVATGLFDSRVRSVPDYIERMRRYVVPMQSMVVADSAGAIGMIAPGRVPVRNPLNRIAGRAPVPGWDALYDWQGWLPFEALPRVVDPPGGAIATANASIVTRDYPHLITHDWEPAYRQRRLDQLILAERDHDTGSMMAAQLDVLSPGLVELAPLMIAAARAAGGADTGLLDRLARWDGRMDTRSREALILTAWLRMAVDIIWRPHLGAAFPSYYGSRMPALTRLLAGKAGSRRWCAGERGANAPPCAMEIGAALKGALGDLERRYGRDRRAWRWGAAHVAIGEHQPFGALPIVGRLFNVEVEVPGGHHTLNTGVPFFGSDRPYASRIGPGYRAIYDFADLERSLYIQSTGQSGNPFSRYYRNLADRWAKGDYITIATRPLAIEAEALGTWLLDPR